MSSLSQGPFNHNRFASLDEYYQREKLYFMEKAKEKKAKKDYDGDGKVESGSEEHAGVVHNAIQRAKGGKPDGQDTRKEAFDPKGARRMDAAKGKKAETEDEKNKRLMLGKYSPAVKYAKTRKEDVEYVSEISKELATKAYAERRTNEFEADELNTKSDKTHKRIVNKFGKKAGEEADKAANKKIFGEEVTDEEFFNFMVENGITESVESAEAVYQHMSDDWFESLYEGLITEKKKGRCWTGYKPTPGKEPYSDGSCMKA